jgi:hypothetical protein
MRILNTLAAVIFAAALPCLAFGQTNPGLTKGQVLTPGQWNALFADKQDSLGYRPVNTNGDIMIGRLVTAPPSSTIAGLNLTPGSAPLSPVNGDFWLTSSGIFARVNGVTIGPISGPSSASFAASSPLSVAFPGGITTYALNTDTTLGCTGSPCVLGFNLNHSNSWAAAQSIAGLTVTGAFTATGLVTLPSLATQAANTVLVNATGGPASPLAQPIASCSSPGNALTWVTNTGFVCGTITAAASGVTVGTTTVTGGPGILFNTSNAGPLSAVAFANNAVLVTNGSGAPSISSTLPSALNVPAPSIIGGSHTAITSLGIRSTGSGAFDMSFANSENLTAGRILTLTLNDAARTINLAGNLSLSAAFSTVGGNAITLTTTAFTNVTLPVTGTLATLAGTESLTGKTINGNTITSGSGTLTLGAGKTFTASNTLAFTGTDGSSVAFGAGGTAAYTQNNLSVFASTTSAQLAGVLSDETGTGAAVFASSPSLITPSLGVASATSVNKVSFTAPATGSTLTILDGKTFTASNSINLAGTDGTTLTGPASSAKIAALDLQGQSLTGGASVTPLALTTGSITVNCGSRPLQTITGATSAWSITAPASDGSCFILMTNASSGAVIPTFSGFTVGSNTGSVLTATGSAVFTISIWRINGVSGFSIFAHQ